MDLNRLESPVHQTPFSNTSNTKKTKNRFHDLSPIKRLKIAPPTLMCLPSDMKTLIFKNLTFSNYRSLSLVCTVFNKVLIPFFSGNHCNKIKDFQVLLKNISSIIQFQSGNNLNKTKLQGIKYELIPSKLDALHNWMLKELFLSKQNETNHWIVNQNNSLNKYTIGDVNQFLLVDADYEDDPYEGFEDKEWLIETVSKQFLEEFHKGQLKNYNRYQFLFFHIPHYTGSEPVDNYIQCLKAHMILACLETKEVVNLTQAVEKKLFSAKLSLINLLESLEEKDLEAIAKKLHLPDDYKNIFTLAQKEKEIRNHIFHFLGGKIENHSPEKCFSHYFRTIFLAYQLGEVEYALYLAAFLPCFIEEYPELCESFWQMELSLIALNTTSPDYLFLLKFVKCMCYPVFLEIDPTYIREELNSYLITIVQSMKQQLGEDQAQKFLNQIDWGLFFTKDEIYQGVCATFTEGLTDAADTIQIKFQPNMDEINKIIEADSISSQDENSIGEEFYLG